MKFSPIVIGTSTNDKGKKEYYSYIIVEKGPRLMEQDREYTEIFNILINKYPILRAEFYDKLFNHYKIVVKGQRDIIINKIKETIINYREK